MFVRDSTYIMAAIKGFGIAIIDLFTFEVIELITFDQYFIIPPKDFDIYKLVPLGTKGARVLLNGEGSFSIHWNRTKHINEETPILEGL